MATNVINLVGIIGRAYLIMDIQMEFSSKITSFFAYKTQSCIYVAHPSQKCDYTTSSAVTGQFKRIWPKHWQKHENTI